jgi:hypothetical protein
MRFSITFVLLREWAESGVKGRPCGSAPVVLVAQVAGRGCDRGEKQGRSGRPALARRGSLDPALRPTATGSVWLLIKRLIGTLHLRGSR